MLKYDAAGVMRKYDTAVDSYDSTDDNRITNHCWTENKNNTLAEDDEQGRDERAGDLTLQTSAAASTTI